MRLIMDNSAAEQWNYISTRDDQAGDRPKWPDATKLSEVSRWFNKPTFLWKPQSEWTIEGIASNIYRERKQSRNKIQALVFSAF